MLAFPPGAVETEFTPLPIYRIAVRPRWRGQLVSRHWVRLSDAGFSGLNSQRPRNRRPHRNGQCVLRAETCVHMIVNQGRAPPQKDEMAARRQEIGRASCRERV